MNNKTIQRPTTVQLLIKEIELNQIDGNHYIQREDGRWGSEVKSSFIGSVTKNEDFDSIKLCEAIVDGARKCFLIDGKQRLTTILSFIHNEFSIGKSVERPVIEYMDKNGNDCEFNIAGKYYKDFPEELQLQFQSCQVNVVTHLDCTDDDIFYHFRRYNNNLKLNPAEKGITYAGLMAREIKLVSENSFFNGDYGHFTETERTNGTVPRVVMETAMTTFHLDDWKKQTAKAGAFLSEYASKEEFDKLDEYFTRLQPICDDERHAMEFCSKNTFIFIPVFDRFTKYNLSDDKFGEFLDALESELGDETVNFLGEDLTFNELNSRQGTKDKTNIVAKIEVLIALMESFLHIDNETTDKEEKAKNISSNEEETLTDFVKEKVCAELIEEDVELYEDCLEDLMDRALPLASKLRQAENHKSMVAIVAFKEFHDVDDDEFVSWLADYGKNNNCYVLNQDRNYGIMLENFKNSTKVA